MFCSFESARDDLAHCQARKGLSVSDLFAVSSLRLVLEDRYLPGLHMTNLSDHPGTRYGRRANRDLVAVTDQKDIGQLDAITLISRDCFHIELLSFRDAVLFTA
jgi:hypothetical protein